MVVSLAPLPGLTANQTDWLLVKAAVVGNEQVTGLVVRFSFHMSGDGSAPIIFGYGLGSNTSGGFVSVESWGGGPERITTTKQLGGVTIELPPSGGISTDGQVGNEFGVGSPLAPNEVVGDLFFGAGVEIDQIHIDSVETKTGVVDVTVVSGAGSTALAAADPRDDGAAVAVGPTAAGGELAMTTTNAGVVGAFVELEFCEPACLTTWRSPDGRVGGVAIASARVPNMGTSVDAGPSSSFAGPAGPWSWTWAGSGIEEAFCQMQGTPVYGAWAPIGADWPMFVQPVGQVGSGGFGCFIV